jgi:hypothetical protein
MSKRYSILVREGSTEKLLCQVDSNPEALVAALQKQTRPMGRRRVQKYDSVRSLENIDSVRGALRTGRPRGPDNAGWR